MNSADFTFLSNVRLQPGSFCEGRRKGDPRIRPRLWMYNALYYEPSKLSHIWWEPLWEMAKVGFICYLIHDGIWNLFMPFMCKLCTGMNLSPWLYSLEIKIIKKIGEHNKRDAAPKQHLRGRNVLSMCLVYPPPPPSPSSWDQNCVPSLR